MNPDASSPAPITSSDVRDRELRWHVRKAAGDSLVGLALSGGGIRSATFGLGVLQALAAMGLFRQLDYLSTVSGGGYIGGWLQAALAHDGGRPDALSLQGEEPPQVRFLRGYSNYLTPRLGLFSGDTWAAVGTSLRNLILNFTILSLSLIAPLYLPWLAAFVFWRFVPAPSEAGPLVGVLSIAGALFVLVVATSTANMARPLRGGGWTSSGASQAKPLQVYALVIVPGLVATWLVSGVMWSLARDGRLEMSTGLATVVAVGALGYGVTWVLGLVTGLVWREARPLSRAQQSVDYGRALWAGGVLVATGMIGGGLATFLMGLAMNALTSTFGSGQNTWLLALGSFPIGVACLMLGASAHIGLAGNYMSDATREWWGRAGGIQVMLTLLLTVLGTLALAGPHAFVLFQQQWQWLAPHQGAIKAVLGVVWAALTGAGVAAGRSRRTKTGEGHSALEMIGTVAPIAFVFGYLLILATFIHAGVPHFSPESILDPGEAFSLCDVEAMLRAESGVATDAAQPDAWDRHCAPRPSPLQPAAAFGGLTLMMFAAGGLAWFFSWRVDLNEFSLHTFYRNRLVRCFLGASRDRHPHPFTGFDLNDDLPLAPMPAAPGAPRRMRPYPIFNAAINLVGGKNLAWQARKAASFVFTPEYCGFEYRDDDPSSNGEARGLRQLSAYAPTSAHAGDPRSITMGLAIATSGAAASPNMGYHTSPTLAFLMTVFNVRLGWWLRNPLKPDVWTSRKSRLSLRELLYELLGMTTDDKDWVYLSDGGHFENLGIYELVRRRCRFIVACDAGQDGDVTFEDLGNAIEKCRADFAVNIEIDLTKLHPVDRRSERHCAVGTIRYDRLPDRDTDGQPLAVGTLLYIKSSLTGDEPADVLRYAAEHPAFPHESTADQFFDESQFESYRALGFHAARDVFRSAVGEDQCSHLESVELFTLVRQRWGVPAPSPPGAVRKYSDALQRIWTMVRTTDELRFLDSQMFPEMPALLDAPYGRNQAVARPQTQVNYWLPASEQERRAGFYVCVEMLQFMEDAFLEFDLDEHYDHIDNRGWMNLFQHWAWSGMLCATWAIAGATFDPRFQRFCWTRLDLRPGVPSVADLPGSIELPAPDEWRVWWSGPSRDECTARLARWQETHGLNFWEAELVGKYLRASRHRSQRLFPIHVTVESPRQADGDPLRFNVGYLIGEVDVPPDGPPRFVLHYMRIQNHLRKMGLAREALLALRRTLGVELAVSGPCFDSSVLDGKASDEALPTEQALIRLRGIVRSLPEI